MSSAMSEILVGLLLVVACLIASILSAATGFGGAAILLPILAAVFGVRDGVPILTVVQLVGNASQVWFNRKEIAFPVIKWFALGSVPAGIMGGILFATAPLTVLHRLLGVFLLFVVVYCHMSKSLSNNGYLHHRPDLLSQVACAGSPALPT